MVTKKNIFNVTITDSKFFKVPDVYSCLLITDQDAPLTFNTAYVCC